MAVAQLQALTDKVLKRFLELIELFLERIDLLITNQKAT